MLDEFKARFQVIEGGEAKFVTQLMREVQRVLYSLVKESIGRPLLLDALDTFFDFLLSLEEAHLIGKKDILNAFYELFECSPE